MNLSLQLQTHWDSVWPIVPQSKWPLNTAECKPTIRIHTTIRASTNLRIARQQAKYGKLIKCWKVFRTFRGRRQYPLCGQLNMKRKFQNTFWKSNGPCLCIWVQPVQHPSVWANVGRAPPNNSHLFIAASHSLYTQNDLIGQLTPCQLSRWTSALNMAAVSYLVSPLKLDLIWSRERPCSMGRCLLAMNIKLPQLSKLYTKFMSLASWTENVDVHSTNSVIFVRLPRPTHGCSCWRPHSLDTKRLTAVYSSIYSLYSSANQGQETTETKIKKCKTAWHREINGKCSIPANLRIHQSTCLQGTWQSERVCSALVWARHSPKPSLSICAIMWLNVGIYGVVVKIFQEFMSNRSFNVQVKPLTLAEAPANYIQAPTPKCLIAAYMHIMHMSPRHSNLEVWEWRRSSPNLGFTKMPLPILLHVYLINLIPLCLHLHLFNLIWFGLPSSEKYWRQHIFCGVRKNLKHFPILFCVLHLHHGVFLNFLNHNYHHMPRILLHGFLSPATYSAFRGIPPNKKLFPRSSI